jgi:hypothetical protein
MDRGGIEMITRAIGFGALLLAIWPACAGFAQELPSPASPRQERSLNAVQLECRDKMNSDIAMGNSFLQAACSKDTMPLTLVFFDMGTFLGSAWAVQLVDATGAMAACNAYPASCDKELAEKLVETFQALKDDGGREKKEREIVTLQNIHDSCIDIPSAIEIFKHAYNCGGLLGLRSLDARTRVRDYFSIMGNKTLSSKAAADAFFESYVKALPPLPVDLAR